MTEGKQEELPKSLNDWNKLHVQQFFNSNDALKRHANLFTAYNGPTLKVVSKDAFEDVMGKLDGSACFGLLEEYKEASHATPSTASPSTRSPSRDAYEEKVIDDSLTTAISSNDLMKVTFGPVDYFYRDALPELKKRLTEPLLAQYESYDVIGIHGVRRCGKSTLIKQAIASLMAEDKIDKNQILYLSMNDPSFNEVSNPIRAIGRWCSKNNVKYLFLDEVSIISGWAANVRDAHDKYGQFLRIVISGSESDLVRAGYGSSLFGRVHSLELKPLSFLEAINFTKFLSEKEKISIPSIKDMLTKYIAYGGFPKVIHTMLLKADLSEARVELRKLWEQIRAKDLVRTFRQTNHDTWGVRSEVSRNVSKERMESKEENLESKFAKTLPTQIEGVFKLCGKTSKITDYITVLERASIIYLTALEDSSSHKLWPVDNGIYHEMLSDSSTPYNFIPVSVETIVYHRLAVLFPGLKIRCTNEFGFIINGTAICRVLTDTTNEAEENCLGILRSFIRHVAKCRLENKPVRKIFVVSLKPMSFPITSLEKFLIENKPTDITEKFPQFPTNTEHPHVDDWIEATQRSLEIQMSLPPGLYDVAKLISHMELFNTPLENMKGYKTNDSPSKPTNTHNSME